MRGTLKFKVNSGPRTEPPTDDAPQCQGPDSVPPSTSAGHRGTGHYPSRSGCTECKRRRVKCDETFPICLRCQRRGALCELPPRLRQWQIVSPSIFRPPKTSGAPGGPGPRETDGVILRYWLERASHIMVIDPDVNPMSFPILEYIERCPSLIHAMQSISAAHRDFFNPTKQTKPLEEQNRAINLLRQELTELIKAIYPIFVTVLQLSLSSD